ncbi:MAG: Gfo/Idh/MocA family oxidoreductase [Syntrophales bacterium]|nr:Gfo/Idh/MocA family oxidoreductase [Syntrophales bacterium]
MTRKLRVGVVGIGHLGTYHLTKYAGIEECEIIGVADCVYEKAIKAANHYSVTAYGDFRQLVGKVDAVSIAVPTAVHYEVAKEFLSAGTDCLLEKPIARTLEEADELIEIARQNNCIFQIGHIERFNPAISALKGALKKPLFVEAHRLHPFFERGTDVDVILDLMIHDLDILLHLIKEKVVRVEAVGVPVLTDKIDIANVRLVFAGGCVANLTASRVTGKTMQKIRFFGEEGYYAVDYGKRELTSLRREQNDEGRYLIVNNDIEVARTDPLEQEIRAFVKACLSRSSPPVSGDEGRKALALALTILEAIKKPSL